MIYHIKKKYETLLASSKQVNSIVTLQQYIRKKKSLTVYLYQFIFIRFFADGIKDNGNLVKSALKTVNPQFDLNRNKMITSTKRFYKQQQIVKNCSVLYNINPK